MYVFVCGADDDDIAKQKPETKQNTNINKFQIKIEHKNKTIRTRNKQKMADLACL